jgi:hypothetical protein
MAKTLLTVPANPHAQNKHLIVITNITTLTHERPTNPIPYIRTDEESP